MREHWLLDPTVAFLNHGSFGACPWPVLDAQSTFQRRLEREPVQFMLADLPKLLDGARERVGAIVNASPRDLVFVTNASEGVNVVLRSLRFEPGDEILITDHAYGACHNAAAFVAERSGAELRIAHVPFPLLDPEQVVEAVTGAVTERTRLALIDHVTSVTGLIWPIERIVSRLRARGVETLVDGAHAPGMVDLDLDALGAGYYAANFHKWGCAPKGAGMLWVRRDLQSGVFPGTVSHGFRAASDQRFRALFDWTGTRDPSAWLCIPLALDFLSGLCDGGLVEVRRQNRALALLARAELCSVLDVAPPAPDEMLGSLVSLPLPLRAERRSEGGFDTLYYDLVERGFEVLVMPWPDDEQLVLRVSAQLYNELDEYRRLALTLRELVARRRAVE